jgi:hypothetical protein
VKYITKPTTSKAARNIPRHFRTSINMTYTPYRKTLYSFLLTPASQKMQTVFHQPTSDQGAGTLKTGSLTRLHNKEKIVAATSNRNACQAYAPTA